MQSEDGDNRNFYKIIWKCWWLLIRMFMQEDTCPLIKKKNKKKMRQVQEPLL